MRRLFISYSRDDKDWVGELYRALREDYDAWMDKRIAPAADWWETILREIEEADCLIYVMTPKSVESVYCRAELDYALALNKPVIPLMLKSSAFPDFLSRRRIQFQTIDEQMTFELVIAIITKGLLGIAQDYMSGKYQSTAANRPSEPQAGIQAIEETFRLAEEAAGQQNGSLAEKLFQQVILKDPQGWGVQAIEQIVTMRTRKMTPINLVGNSLQSVISVPASIQPLHSLVYDILPVPFEWIEIPGKIGKKWKGSPFAIAKYPVTNTHFRQFVEAGGYLEHKWWTEAGWQQREREKWTQPRYWTDKSWNGSEQPVVGMSWYEAVAFCLWLSDMTGEKIMLPTEKRWQYAAQGDDGRDYPWGKNWDASRCNNNAGRKGIGMTTPVRQYEGEGDSFFGVVDIAGNVWEWSLTDYDNKSNDVNSHPNRGVLLGGSWNSLNVDNFRADYRNWNSPNSRNLIIGFRFALTARSLESLAARSRRPSTAGE